MRSISIAEGLTCMAKTENCPKANGGINTAKLLAASKLIRMKPHLHRNSLLQPTSYERFLVAYISF